ncbi:Uncharacterised protein [uncultured archaeon]|nr:Uncharacterised protein [uncultured archaeon]
MGGILSNYVNLETGLSAKTFLQYFFDKLEINLSMHPQLKAQLDLNYHKSTENRLKDIQQFIRCQSHNNHKNKIKYIKMIKSEMEMGIIALEQSTVQLLPVDAWTSAVSSGDLKLFKVDTELQQLRLCYNNIENYNKRASKYIGYPWERLEREDGHRLPFFQVKQLLDNRNSLLYELKELKNAKWLTAVSTASSDYS